MAQPLIFAGQYLHFLMSTAPNTHLFQSSTKPFVKQKPVSIVMTFVQFQRGSVHRSIVPTVLPISSKSGLLRSQGRSIPSTIYANHMIVNNPQAMVCISSPKGKGLRPTHIQSGKVYLLINYCMLSSSTLTQEGSKTFVVFAFHASSI